jgi:hypothetical protein
MPIRVFGQNTILNNLILVTDLMAAALVDYILLSVTTGKEDIDRDERVFLGIGGREFKCKRKGDRAENPFHEKNKM